MYLPNVTIETKVLGKFVTFVFTERVSRRLATLLGPDFAPVETVCTVKRVLECFGWVCLNGEGTEQQERCFQEILHVLFSCFAELLVLVLRFYGRTYFSRYLSRLRKRFSNAPRIKF